MTFWSGAYIEMSDHRRYGKSLIFAVTGPMPRTVIGGRTRLGIEGACPASAIARKRAACRKRRLSCGCSVVSSHEAGQRQSGDEQHHGIWFGDYRRWLWSGWEGRQREWSIARRGRLSDEQVKLVDLIRNLDQAVEEAHICGEDELLSGVIERDAVEHCLCDGASEMPNKGLAAKRT